MTKIKMLKTTPGALNGGLTVHIFKEGLIYPNSEIVDLEGLDEIFLNIGVAHEYVKPAEVIRHEKGLTGAPENKREVVSENKEVSEQIAEDLVDPDDGDDFFTLEELEGSKAKDIRALAEENDIDLTDFPKNTSAEILINAFLSRQGTIAGEE